jgi:hypothetical protein
MQSTQKVEHVECSDASFRFSGNSRARPSPLKPAESQPGIRDFQVASGSKVPLRRDHGQFWYLGTSAEKLSRDYSRTTPLC